MSNAAVKPLEVLHFPNFPINVLVNQGYCFQMLLDAMTACRRLSDPEFVRCMLSKADFKRHTVQALKGLPLAVVPSEMTQAQANAADLYNHDNKAEKAHAAQVRNASRLPAFCRSPD